MLGSERQGQILEYLKKNQTVSVKKLTETLYISEATARRDLNELCKTGLVKRVYGGAQLAVSADRQVPLFVRERENEGAKSKLCREAAELVSDGDVLFIDGSSTAQVLVKYLYKFRDITVITTGLKIAEMLGKMHIKTYCTGGRLREDSSVFVGRDAERSAARFNADICFISCKGMDQNGRFTDTSEEETELRQVFMQNSKKKVVLLTADKIGKSYLYTLCRSSEVDRIFTDGTLPDTVKTREEMPR